MQSVIQWVPSHGTASQLVTAVHDEGGDGPTVCEQGRTLGSWFCGDGKCPSTFSHHPTCNNLCNRPERSVTNAGTEKTQRRSQRRQQGLRGFTIHAATLPGQGGGVLDRPVLDKPTPGRESEFDIKRKKQVSPPYRVMLHNDNFNKREYVVQVLMKVIPGMTVDIAVNVMQEAHVNGLAVVIICPQHDAEEHCMQLRNNGLLSSIEPATGGC